MHFLLNFENVKIASPQDTFLHHDLKSIIIISFLFSLKYIFRISIKNLLKLHHIENNSFRKNEKFWRKRDFAKFAVAMKDYFCQTVKMFLESFTFIFGYLDTLRIEKLDFFTEVLLHSVQLFLLDHLPLLKLHPVSWLQASKAFWYHHS